MLCDFILLTISFKVIYLVIQMEQIKEWKQQNRNITRKLQAIDKEVAKMFPFNNTTDLKIKIQKLFQQDHNKNNDRNIEEGAVFHSLKDINNGIKQLKQHLKFYEKKNDYLVKIQNLSQNIVTKIQGFKTEMAQKYDQCADLEDEYTRDLQLFENKINQYENNEIIKQEPVISGTIELQKGKQNKVVNKQQAKTIQVNNFVAKTNIFQEKLKKFNEELKNKNSEMESIEIQIRSLGKNYGWPEDDHNDFVNIWNRRRGNNYFQLEQQCQKYFKMYTDQQIHTHIEKHKAFLDLQEQKKQLLHQYKLLKEQKRDVQLKMIQKQQEQKQQKQDKFRKQLQMQKQEKERKQKLLQWKLMKETKKQIEQMKQKQEEQKKLQLIRIKQRQIQQKKAVVQQWKRQQQERRTQQLKQSTNRTKQTLDKETIQKIRQRQDNMVMKKIQLVKNKELEELERLKKQQELKDKKYVKYHYLNSKLEQKTTAIKQKQRTKFDGKNPKNADTFGGKIGYSLGKAIPSWRQGL